VSVGRRIVVVVTGSTPPSRLVGGVTVPAVGVWVFDSDHVFVGFRADRLGRFPVRGRFTSVTGHVNIGADPADSTVVATVATATVSAGCVEIDARLRSPDHLDVDRHPTAEFRSTDVEWAARGARVGGLLTMVGATDRIELDVRYRGTVTDPWGQQRSGFSAFTVIDRDNWGLGWNVTMGGGGVLVSRRICVQIDVETVRQPNSSGDRC
jgi:polyisoprenoid-binding protein YceI